MNVTVTITVGRNVPTAGLPVEMDAVQWGGFRDTVTAALGVIGAEVFVAAAKGTGYWDGIIEENATWVAAVPQGEIEFLRREAARWCRLYSQDAVALTVGSTELIAA